MAFESKILTRKNVSHLNMNEETLIYLLFPGIKLMEVLIIPNQQIKSLKNIINIQEDVLIFNGEKLQINFLFSFYNIQNKDIIIILKKLKGNSNEKNENFEKWIKKSKKTDNLQKRIFFLKDIRFKRSILKLNDLKIEKNEKKLLNYFQKNQSLNISNKIESCNNFENNMKLINPSNSPLPIFW